ncbi:MAG: hypothetical protein JWO97_1146 [Acidobacteria bacterium]|nr:hypothetical protein [Acidobacteriota bacterium]
MLGAVVHVLKNARDNGVGIVLGLLAGHRRFAAAIYIANVLGPLREVIARLRGRPLRLGSGREYTLAYLLGCMDLRELRFATRISVIGLDALRRAVALNRGVLVVTTHANAGLARLVLRPLADSNIRCVTISGGRGFPICGTGAVGPTIAPTGTFLVAVRSKLRAGLVVCAMVDAPVDANRTRRHVTVDGGSTWLAEPLIQLVARWQVPIAVLKASFENDRVLLEVQISDSQNTSDVVLALSSSVPLSESVNPSCERRALQDTASPWSEPREAPLGGGS